MLTFFACAKKVTKKNANTLRSYYARSLVKRFFCYCLQLRLIVASPHLILLSHLAGVVSRHQRLDEIVLLGIGGSRTLLLLSFTATSHRGLNLIRYVCFIGSPH